MSSAALGQGRGRGGGVDGGGEHPDPGVGSQVSQHVHVDWPENGVSLDKVKILTVENRKFEGRLEETVYIGVAKASLDRDGGHYLLPAVWSNMLRARVCPPPPPQPVPTLTLRSPT